ncbi:hypothetical protein LCGC14_1323150 [marine sediment metagenome]|uniref:GDP-mannose 4,6-dehydratase n=1 Tax=marine sediment metagenome TaxID=412755 RepID=A0A0F9MZP1_9ZZZZ
MSKKVALITGITGQDGSYLAEFLLAKNYEVHGIIRRSSSFNTQRIDHIFDPEDKTHIHYGQLDDGIDELLYQLQPDEVYNIGSMSHVSVSFKIPIYTARVTGLAPLRILEGIRLLRLEKKTKFYQASSSEMFGITPPPQNENSLFQPVSPYGCAKLFGYHITRTYRKGYGIFASNGILFNHESPRRGERFVTRKITRAVTRIKLGLQEKLILGNLDAKRDWGFAGDYVEAMWMILQHDKPDDFVVSTGEFYSVREFAEKVFKKLGLDFYEYLVTNERFYRPNEVPELRGDATKARKVLGWKPKVGFEELVDMMIEYDSKH